MPAPALTLAPFANPLPSIVTATVEPAVPCEGDTELTTTGAATLTVNAFASDPPPPFGLVTTTSRPPAAAAPSIANDALRRVEDTKATLLTVIPAPALTVAPLANPLPSIVTGTVEPAMPWAGDTELTVTGTATVNVIASASDPPLPLGTATTPSRAGDSAA